MSRRLTYSRRRSTWLICFSLQSFHSTWLLLHREIFLLSSLFFGTFIIRSSARTCPELCFLIPDWRNNKLFSFFKRASMLRWRPVGVDDGTAGVDHLQQPWLSIWTRPSAFSGCWPRWPHRWPSPPSPSDWSRATGSTAKRKWATPNSTGRATRNWSICPNSPSAAYGRSATPIVSYYPSKTGSIWLFFSSR